MVNLALAWAEVYGQLHPEVQIAVTGGGSGTGIAALINGTVDMANASRRIKDEERDDAEANGIEPVEHVVAGDAIAIVVHPSNPVEGLTIPQLSAIFSGQISNWRVPPASMIAGELYPDSLADNARQISLPVSLSNATTTLPWPPTMQTSLRPSTSGWPA